MEFGGEVALARKALPQRGPRPFTDRRAHSLKTRRERLPWPADKPFRILSLDGGGIRGLYAATILARVEQDLLGGGRIADHVDMIAGTSTGGIIAIGLGLGRPAALIHQLYAVDGEKVFPPFWNRHPKLRFWRRLMMPLFNARKLEELLFRTFGAATLGQSDTRLVIPAFLGPKTDIAVFKTDHHPDFKKDHLMAAWEAARATSAAPTYFPGHKGDDYVFLDGGVWCNNPIMAAVVDALSAYDVERDQIEILSIGTGNPPYEISRFATRGGIFQWREIILGAMYLTTDNAQAQATLLLGPDHILRLEPTGAAAAIDLADWSAACAQLQPQAQEAFKANRDRLAAFFAAPADPRHRFYTGQSADAAAKTALESGRDGVAS